MQVIVTLFFVERLSHRIQDFGQHLGALVSSAYLEPVRSIQNEQTVDCGMQARRR